MRCSVGAVSSRSLVSCTALTLIYGCMLLQSGNSCYLGVIMAMIVAIVRQSRGATAHTWHQSAACMSGRYRKGNPSCIGPPLQYKLSNTRQHARTPQWLLRMLHNQHGTLYDPCPHSPSSDGLYTPWSSSKVNFVNPPFGDAKEWLHKAAEEAGKHKHSIVLVPFRAHTKYMSVHTLQHAVSVCVLSKPIRFRGSIWHAI